MLGELDAIGDRMGNTEIATSLARTTAVTKRRVLYLPVETKSRELLGKTFLAARAVERGWMVVMAAHLDTRKLG